MKKNALLRFVVRWLASPALRALALLLLLATAFSPLWAAERPADWAQPVQLDGVPNCYRLTENLYRSAQPTAAGMKNLEEMGVKTILNLRNFHDDRELVQGTRLKSLRIDLNALSVSEADLEAVLKVLQDPANWPILIHCQHGSDRTGTACAMYRIVLQGWSQEAAIKEMVEGGYGYHEILVNLPELIRKIDADALKKRLAPVPAVTPAPVPGASGTSRPPPKTSSCWSATTVFAHG